MQTDLTGLIISTEPKSYFRTARLLNILINVIIGVLFLLLAMFIAAGVMTHMDPSIANDVPDELNSQTGISASASSIFTGGIAGGIIIISAYLYVAFVVRAIVKTTVNGNPFVSANISRLRKTWIVIVLAEIVRMIATAIIKSGETGGEMKIEISYQAWFLAFFIAIMAEVFRIGLELRRDQELTV